MPIGIENIEYYLPKASISSNELAQRFGFSLQFVEKKIGVKRIFTAGENEMSSDLAVKAVEKLFNTRPDIKDRVDIIVVITQTPDYQLPHTAALVQKKIGLKESVASFDLSLGCSGFVYGLSILKGFMEQNKNEYGILVTVDTYSKIIDNTDKNTKPLFSDAAAATLLSRKPILIPQRFTFGTSGYKYDKLILRSRNKSQVNDDDFLYMDGRGIFELVADEVPRDINKCLALNGVALPEIDYFIFHQASSFMLDTLKKKLGIDDDSKVINCIDQYGNTVSSSIPMVIKTALPKLRDKKVKLLISGFGVGLSWSSTILLSNGR